MDENSWKISIRVRTYFQSSHPRSIDFLLTDTKMHFKNTLTIEAGFSDFHAMIITVLRGNFIRQEPELICYRNYRKSNATYFGTDLNHEKFCCHVDADNSSFNYVLEKVLGADFPLKKYTRVTDEPCMTKAL